MHVFARRHYCVCVFACALGLKDFNNISLNDNHVFCCGLTRCFDCCPARLRSSVGSGFLVSFAQCVRAERKMLTVLTEIFDVFWAEIMPA